MWTILGTVAVVSLTIGAGLVIERRFGPRRALRDHAAKRLHAPGDSPATALDALPRCAGCRGALAIVDEDRVAYAGRELRVIRATCARCNVVRSVFVR